MKRGKEEHGMDKKQQQKDNKDAHGPEEQVSIDRRELEELRQRAGEREAYHNKWLNVHAEYQNVRRRLEKEKVDHMKFANEDIISRLFPIMDNFDMAIAAMDKADDKTAVLDGVKLVLKEFHKVLEDNGVSRIETSGKEFDPHLHEAVSAVSTEEHPDDSIIKEIRPGYLLNGRLLRPAQVIVARNPGAGS